MERLLRITIWTGMLVMLNVGVSMKGVSDGVDLCDKPFPDPCVPGGKWDPLLERLVQHRAS